MTLIDIDIDRFKMLDLKARILLMELVYKVAYELHSGGYENFRFQIAFDDGKGLIVLKLLGGSNEEGILSWHCYIAGQVDYMAEKLKVDRKTIFLPYDNVAVVVEIVD
jgi:hypothetical protein